MKNSILLLLLSVCALTLSAQKLERVWGVVSDSETQMGIPDVEVQIHGRLETMKSDDKGNFSQYFEDLATNSTVKFRRKGYENYDLQITVPLSAPLDIRLKKFCDPHKNKPEISITKLDFGNEITGEVNCVPDSLLGKYKIIVYVFTDQYYIHSYPNSDFPVQSNGEWSLPSVWHPGSTCPSKVMALLVPNDYQPYSPTPKPMPTAAIARTESGSDKIICKRK